VFYVNYLTDPRIPAYRYCDRPNGERHWEGLSNLGGVPNKKLVPGKIHDIDPNTRKDIMFMLQCCNIFCFGRYATWRSNELVHQTWKDIVRFKETL
jgi:hypothetical protein